MKKTMNTIVLSFVVGAVACAYSDKILNYVAPYSRSLIVDALADPMAPARENTYNVFCHRWFGWERSENFKTFELSASFREAELANGHAPCFVYQQIAVIAQDGRAFLTE